MKLNKQIKTHIADMAIRKKYKAEFEKRLADLTVKARKTLYDINHNADFDVLPERAKHLIQTCSGVNLPNGIAMASYKYGYDKVERGFLLNIAFDTRKDITMLTFQGETVYAPKDYKGCAQWPEELNGELKEFTNFLKEASQARQTLIDAMVHYKSTNKMFAELPWAEQFYPEQEKKTACNIVPVSTIAAANDLMGVKTQ